MMLTDDSVDTTRVRRSPAFSSRPLYSFSVRSRPPGAHQDVHDLTRMRSIVLWQHHLNNE
jgi:hypothetical protein